MFTIALLSALLVGQGCSGPNCRLQAAPSYEPQLPVSGLHNRYPSLFDSQVAQPQPSLTIVTRRTNYKGLTFDVRGVLDSGANEFAWDWSDSFNVQSYRAAVARRAPPKAVPKVAVKSERI